MLSVSDTVEPRGEKIFSPGKDGRSTRGLVRRARMIKWIEEQNGPVKVAALPGELSSEFDVSARTVRDDLLALRASTLLHFWWAHGAERVVHRAALARAAQQREQSGVLDAWTS